MTLVIGLAVALGGSALAAPGEDDTPIPNPDLQTACGIDIHVILDESGSVRNYANDVRTAFRAFTGALDNTGSRMAVSEFSTVARLPLPGAAARDYTVVTDATIASTFEPYITNGYRPDGNTHWEDAFRIGRYFLPRPSQAQPHLVLFVTDGDPNRIVRDSRVTYDPGNPIPAQNEYELKVPLADDETTSTNNNPAKDRAVSNANALKAQGSHILTVAVGEGLNSQSSLNRIIDVSGPDVYSGSGTFDISTDDVYRVEDFSDLEDAMREAAFQLCAPSITVRKLVDHTPDPGTDDAVPGEGWDMTATADPAPAEWILPAGATGDTATSTTDASGFVTFQWNTTTPADSTVTIAEEDPGGVPPGFVNDPDATECTYRTPDQDDTPLDIDVTDGGFSATVPDEAIVTCTMVNREPPDPAITIEKDTNGVDADDPPGPLIPALDPVDWTYLVTNTGNVTLSQIEVTDDQGVAVDCGGVVSLPPGDSVTCAATGIAMDISYANVGSVTAVDPFGTPVSDDDPSHYTGAVAGIDVEKATNGEDADDAPGPYIPVGDDVEWTYVITNTGDTTLEDVTLEDNVLGTIACGDGTLDPNEQATCTATGVTTAGQYENVATASGVNELGQTAEDSDPSHYFGEDPSVDIEKSTNGEDADDPTGPFVPIGDRVGWRYVVTNTGNVPLQPWSVTDDQGVPVACPRLGILPPGNSVICFSTGPAGAGQYANVGSVTGTSPSGAEVDDEDPSHYFGEEGAIQIEKSTNGEDADEPPGAFVPVGGAVTWSYEVTNIGNVPLSDVDVIDLRGPGVTCPQTELDVDESMTCEATGVAEVDQYTNFAITEGFTPNQDRVFDHDPSHYFGAEPGILLQKHTNGVDADEAPGPFIPVGEPVEWTYIVTNSGNDELTDVTVTDDQGVDVTCPQDTLAVGEEMTCVATGTSVEGDYENTGAVTATDTLGEEVSDADPSHYFGAVSAIQVEKATNGADADQPTGPHVPPAGAVTWTYVVTNPGNVPIKDVELTDSDAAVTPQFVGGDANANTDLDPGETWTYRATGTARTGQYANTATVRGLDLLENELTDGDPSHYFGDALPPPIPPPQPPQPPEPEPPRARPQLDLRKVAMRKRVRSGRVVRFRLRVRNTGDGTARRVRVCDRLPSGLVYAKSNGARVQGRRACFRVRRLRPGRSRTFTIRARAARVQRAKRVCNVAVRSARRVRARQDRACIRILPRVAQRPGGVTG